MTVQYSFILCLAIIVPAILSILTLIKPIRRVISLATAMFVFYLAIRIFLMSRLVPMTFEIVRLSNVTFSLYADTLSGFILVSIGLFTALIALYSDKALEGCPNHGLYPSYILLTLAAANGVALSHNIFLIVFFWGFLVAMLYAMMMISKKDPAVAAQKSFLIIGISDIFLLLGLVMLFVKWGVSTITPARLVNFDQPIVILIYIFILIGILAKAGAMPLHSWIPEAAKVAPAPTMAFIPASLDKLLGIYLLMRVSYFIFDISNVMSVRLILMIVGAVTIVAAVMMAMIQKEAMRLLAFHAVSQVGYMILGIGTGIPIAVAGGLFHMLNNAIYKACLFLSAGSVEYRAKTTELDRLGGLGVKMPLTMLSFIVAAFAISGVPPLNGFYSKWMIYQGIVELSRETNLWPIFLVAAMFGSVLTLASFLKMIHSVFLGGRPRILDKVKEASFDMVLPTLILALLCIVFGIFAVQVPLRYLIFSSLPFPVVTAGYWAPMVATALIIISLAIGGIIFLAGTATKPRRSPIFVGGEIIEEEAARIPGTEFYSPIKSMGYLAKIYHHGEEGVYDLYNVLTRYADGIAKLVFKYIDRVIDQFVHFIPEIIRVFSTTLRSVISWYLIIVVVPLLFYWATGSLASLRIFAVMLLLAGPVIALTEDDLNRFLIAITFGQIGLITISLGSGEIQAYSTFMFQFVNSLLGLVIVYVSVKTAIRLTGSTKVEAMQGLANNASIAAIGFVAGGLMLSCLPPSINFLSKFMTSTLFEAKPLFILFISLSTLLNLAAFLRVIRKVFLGPSRIEGQKKFGHEELLIIILILISFFLFAQAGFFIRLFGIYGGMT